MAQLVLFAPVICGVLNLAAAGIGLTAAVLTRRAARVDREVSTSCGSDGEIENHPESPNRT